MPAWLEVLLRSIGLFIVVFVLVKILGKKHPSKFTPFRFITYTVIGVITAVTLVGAVDVQSGAIALAVWFLLPIAGEFLALRSKAVHDIINGREAIVVSQGKVMEDNLKQVRLTGEELLSELRNKNVFNLADVEFAVLEPTGDLNVLLKSEKAPLSSYDLGRKVAPRREPQTIILDGNILNEQLTALGLNQHWVKEQLENAGALLDNVFLGQVDSSGELYLDFFDDAIQPPQPQVKEMLYAKLEKAQADLKSFALETEDQEAKNMYGDYAAQLESMLAKLEPHLLH